jgi:hypothetical protein
LVQVLSVCEYLTGSESRKPDHFKPFNLIQAIKGKELASSFPVNIKAGGRWFTFKNDDKDPAIACGAALLAEQIAQHFPGRKIALVPIPGHRHASAGDVEAGRLFAMAKACAAELSLRRGVDASPVALLHWKAPGESSRGGGTRNVDELDDLYTLNMSTADAMDGRTVVLLDDVVTTGGHILAAKKHIAENSFPDYPVAELAFAVARTVHVKDGPFKVTTEPCPRPMPDPEPIF